MTGLPASLGLYRAATTILEPLAPAVLRWRGRRGKEVPARTGERLGRTAVARPQGLLVWLHAASVGEGLSLLPLAEALAALRPDLALLVTSGTVTSAELLGRRLPPGALHQFVPIDAPGAARRFLGHWRPQAAVFVESELWPNLLLEAERNGVRLALVSARLSARSLAGWARAPAAAGRILGAFDLVMAQDEVTAQGLRALGARDDGRLNLKFAGAPLPADPAALAQVNAAAGGRPILLAASTHPGEEAQVVRAFAPLAARGERPLLVIVPRHPARGPEVAGLASELGWIVHRQAAGEAFDGRADVYVADTLGELGLWFRAARTAFVGGSLIGEAGGHNPLEPARLDCPILVGPNVTNWTTVYQPMLAQDMAQQVRDSGSLAAAFAEALERPEAGRARAARARAFAEAGAEGVGEAAARVAELAA